MNLRDLYKPFPETSIHWRIGSTNKRKTPDGKPTKGIPLAYIDARDVMERLDTVCGPENWQCRYPYQGCCEIGIRINGEWVWKADGAGQSDIEAEKGQYSDAFKRAAVKWGVGQYLYDLPNIWVDMDNYGKPKEQPKLPQWATPNGWRRIPPDEKKAFFTQMVDCMDRNDQHGMLELIHEYDQEQQLQLWEMFNASQRNLIKKVKAGI